MIFIVLCFIFLSEYSFANRCNDVEKEFVENGVYALNLRKTLREAQTSAYATETNLKKQCPNCSLISILSSELAIRTPLSTCHANYLKNYTYKKQFFFQNETCDIKQLRQTMEDYIEGVLIGKNEDGLVLLDKCPEGCSYHADYVTETHESTCTGFVDLRVQCTHQAERGFFVNIYDVKVGHQAIFSCQ